MKTAIVHYWLNGMRGGEKVLEAFSDLYPSADIFTHVLNEDEISEQLTSHSITTSFVDDLPYSNTLYQYYLPLMPVALEELDLSDYDLVISSESGPAKGVITGPNTLHVCYCHSPMRYLWDMKEEYFGNDGFLKRVVMAPLLHYLRAWDQMSADRVDRFVSNSSFVRQRIKKIYRRDAEIINPPVAVDQFTPRTPEDYFLFVGELVPYKRAKLAIRTFNELELPLRVVGSGEQEDELKRLAGETISFMGYLEDDELAETYASARALIFPGKEDFGIVPVEAMASGCPVIAYGEGGVLDSVNERESGIFFEEQTVKSLVGAVEQFGETSFDRVEVSRSVKKFRPDRFKESFYEFVERSKDEFFE